MLILQTEGLMYIHFQTTFLGQFAPAAIVAAPNNIAPRIRQPNPGAISGTGC